MVEWRKRRREHREHKDGKRGVAETDRYVRYHTIHHLMARVLLGSLGMEVAAMVVIAIETSATDHVVLRLNRRGV